MRSQEVHVPGNAGGDAWQAVYPRSWCAQPWAGVMRAHAWCWRWLGGGAGAAGRGAAAW